MRSRSQCAYFACILLGAWIEQLNVAHAQMGGGGGIGGFTGVAGSTANMPPGTAYGGAADPSMVQLAEGFRLIPSISVGQRYDSNVFFVPKSFGLDRDDFVTTTVPQLRGLYEGRWASVNAVTGAIGEYYAKNTGLSYVGTNAGLLLDLSRFAQQWRPGATWQVTEFYMYTPQPPAFLTGSVEAAAENSFVRGYQVGRVNYQNNNVGTNLSVPLNQTLNVTGSYSNGFIKFGSSQVQQVGTLRDVNSQMYAAGVAMTATRQDTVRLDFVGSEYSYGSTGSFTTRGPRVGWTHQFTPAIGISSTAGAQFLEAQFQGTQSSTVVTPVGSFNATWRDRTTTLGLAYLYTVSPSFQFQAQALRTHTVSFSLVQVTPVTGLSALIAANYARGDAFGSSSSFSISYVSYGGSAGLVYRFTPRTFLRLNYSYTNYDNKFGGNSFAFDRNVAQLFLTHAFY